MLRKFRILNLAAMKWLAAAAVSVLIASAPAKAADPIKIGLGMALTGPLAANGKMSLLAM
jgi:branched-chain amino acid transport system substrate-binding protein